jgi:hypothetical protein
MAIRQKRKLTYIEKDFDVDHVAFKQSMNNILRDLVRKYIPLNQNIVYLDAENAQTTQILQNLCYNLFLANDDPELIKKIKINNSNLNVDENNIEDALKTTWAHLTFHVAYFDACHASHEKIIAIISAFQNRRFHDHVPIILAYTLLGRSNVRDKGQRSQLNRTKQIEIVLHEMAAKLRRKLLRAADLPEYKNMIWYFQPKSVYTEFFIFTPTCLSIQDEVIDVKENQSIKLLCQNCKMNQPPSSRHKYCVNCFFCVKNAIRRKSYAKSKRMSKQTLVYNSTTNFANMMTHFKPLKTKQFLITQMLK